MARAAKKRSTGDGRNMPIYKSYVFKDKEPVIDLTRTLFEDVYGRKVDNAMLTEIETNGGPTVGCMRGWFFGDTRRPNNVTVEAAGRSLGYERVWKKMKTA